MNTSNLHIWLSGASRWLGVQADHSIRHSVPSMHCHLRGVPAAYKSPKSQGVNSQNLAAIYWEELHRLTGLSHHMFLLKLSTQEIDRVGENGYPCKPPSSWTDPPPVELYLCLKQDPRIPMSNLQFSATPSQSSNGEQFSVSRRATRTDEVPLLVRHTRERDETTAEEEEKYLQMTTKRKQIHH